MDSGGTEATKEPAVKEEACDGDSPIDREWIEEYIEYMDDEMDDGEDLAEAAKLQDTPCLQDADKEGESKCDTKMKEGEQSTLPCKMLHEQLIDQHNESVRSWQEQVGRLSSLSQYSHSKANEVSRRDE
eukprot:749274-Hanusia_phi.AAC.1